MEYAKGHISIIRKLIDSRTSETYQIYRALYALGYNLLYHNLAHHQLIIIGEIFQDFAWWRSKIMPDLPKL